MVVRPKIAVNPFEIRIPPLLGALCQIGNAGPPP
jgi:hypothetical protein